jgi:hypothetical protein
MFLSQSALRTALFMSRFHDVVLGILFLFISSWLRFILASLSPNSVFLSYKDFYTTFFLYLLMTLDSSGNQATKCLYCIAGSLLATNYILLVDLVWYSSPLQIIMSVWRFIKNLNMPLKCGPKIYVDRCKQKQVAFSCSKDTNDR